jgi:hypothetical protein
MKTRVDFRELSAEYNRSRTIAPVFKERVKVRIKAKSLTVVGRMKLAMPVDTGAARARWGTPGAPGGVWIEQDEGLTIIQGAELQPYEYIERLNEGSSQQAPAGFVDTIAYKAEEELVQEIINDIANGF